jgi:predicted DNA-binding transcriptional regulator
MTNNGASVNSSIDEFMIVPLSSKRKFKAPFYLAFLQASTEIAKMKLSGTAINIFLYVVGSLAFENYISINQAKIAKELQIHPTNVSKGIKILIERGIIERMTYSNGTKGYRLSPTIGWRGHVDKIKRIKQNGTG